MPEQGRASGSRTLAAFSRLRTEGRGFGILWQRGWCWPSMSTSVAHKVASEGKATAYVCRMGVCELPATDPEVFASQIRSPGR